MHHDAMTARTEQQVLIELTRIFLERTDFEQFDCIPPREVLRVDFARLTTIVGAKYARILCRRCGFSPEPGDGQWWRSYARGEGHASLDLDTLDADFRLAIDDLDPTGLTTPFQRGRVFPV